MGANGLRRRAVAMNSSEPPKMIAVIAIGYQNEKPETFV